MTEIKWVTPPLPMKNERHPDFWLALHANPGDWAEYPGPSLNTTQINRRKRTGGHYEAKQRSGKMIVRWVVD